MKALLNYQEEKMPNQDKIKPTEKSETDIVNICNREHIHNSMKELFGNNYLFTYVSLKINSS